ncbi:SGNH/GDSL hydrolase family protein [Agitococcus lubricus]|uniref:GDSL-like lipase/acylhydrolase family protein n=1 Tax=Agitococcus lubricus TaxID=1077255 RepID=A0A2T5J2J4_9GAMM|nr:SGNH/GDSL hydrolase family protein [Agitococcus lubricus]PTQ90743.1 GDSL-like lipase/acylhydrolase family protein [Agitococcus lubricus]
MRVLWLSLIWLLQACSTSHPNIADTRLNSPQLSILAIGDSLTNGGKNNNYREPLAELTKLTVLNYGVGGQRSDHISARLGLRAIDVSAKAGFFIEGRNELSRIFPPPITSQGAKQITCQTLTHIQCEIQLVEKTYFLTLTESVNTQNLQLRTPLIDTTNSIGIIWVGRNNAAQTERVLSDIELIVNQFKHHQSSYLILTVLNGQGEGVNTGIHTKILELNRRLIATYGQQVLDIRQVLVDSYRQDDAVDINNYQQDIVPQSLRKDGLHLNAQGNQIVAQAIYNKLTALKLIQH